MKLVATLALLALTASTVEAAPEAASAPKSESTALALSIGGEVASLVLIAAPAFRIGGCSYGPSNGLRECDDLDAALPMVSVAGVVGTLVAPSLGHWYAGKPFTRGLKTRLLGVGIAAAGALLFADACLAEGCSRAAELPGQIVMAAGGVAYLVGTVDDLSSVRRAVRESNRRQLALTPIPVRSGGGLALVGQF